MQLYTCAGGMRLIYLKDFPQMVARQMIGTENVEIARMTGMPYASLNVDEARIVEQQVEKLSYKLPEILEVSHSKLVTWSQGTKELMLREELDRAVNQAITQEFKIMVAQKTPDFFIKDMNLEAIENLSNKYMENFGDSSMLGMELRLSPYQKFFAVTSAEYYKFYIHQVQDMSRLGQVFQGKLIDFYPNKWVMGRYENMEYLKELSAMSARTYTKFP